jgi:hypothetical protein
MIRTILTVAALGLTAATFAPDPARAGNDCPPGLAKKNPPCVPPGLAKKGIAYDWRLGDRLTGDYRLTRDWGRYDLPPLEQRLAYAILSDHILRVDRDTLEVLAIVRLLDRVLD